MSDFKDLATVEGEEATRQAGIFAQSQLKALGIRGSKLAVILFDDSGFHVVTSSNNQDTAKALREAAAHLDSRADTPRIP